MTTTLRLESMEVQVAATRAAQLAMTTASDSASISGAMERGLDRLGAFLRASGIEPTGPPRALFTSRAKDQMHITVAVPISALPRPGNATVDDTAITVGVLPESRALRFVHRGPYDEIAETYARIENWLRERGGIHGHADWARYAPIWEEYLNEPATTPASELVTRIYLTLR